MTIVEPLFVLFMMMVSLMISFYRACLCLYVRLSLGVSGICNVMSTSPLMSSNTSSLMSSNMSIISMSTYVVMGCFVRTSFSAVVSLLLLRLTIASVVLGCCVRW